MRNFKVLEHVEHLGSGVPRILEIYPRKCFRFTNFIRFTMPNAWNLSGDEENNEITDQVTDQVIRLISVISGEKSRPELMENLQLKHGQTFRKNYLQPSLDFGFLEMTQPDAPNSPTQKYRLTEKGKTAQKLWKK